MQNLSKIGDCETCARTEVEIKCYYSNMWQCDECHQKDVVHQSPEKQEERVNAYRIEVNAQQTVLQQAKSVDDGINVRTDLFNAATVAIIDLKREIDSDESITNKPYKLAETLRERFEHFRNIVFELNEKIAEAGNQQRAIQVYLNNLANSLRSDEREKLKIADINYKPQPVTVRKIKSVTTRGKAIKFDKVALKKYAAELGVAEFTLQSFVIAQGISVEEAANKIRKSIADAKAQ